MADNDPVTQLQCNLTMKGVKDALTDMKRALEEGPIVRAQEGILDQLAEMNSNVKKNTEFRLRRSAEIETERRLASVSHGWLQFAVAALGVAVAAMGVALAVVVA